MSRKTICAWPRIFMVLRATTSRTGPYVENSMYRAVRRSAFCIFDDGKFVTYKLHKLDNVESLEMWDEDDSRLIWWNRLDLGWKGSIWLKSSRCGCGGHCVVANCLEDSSRKLRLVDGKGPECATEWQQDSYGSSTVRESEGDVLGACEDWMLKFWCCAARKPGHRQNVWLGFH
jgi:hypothetical protein